MLNSQLFTIRLPLHILLFLVFKPALYSSRMKYSVWQISEIISSCCTKQKKCTAKSCIMHCCTPCWVCWYDTRRKARRVPPPILRFVIQVSLVHTHSLTAVPVNLLQADCLSHVYTFSIHCMHVRLQRHLTGAGVEHYLYTGNNTWNQVEGGRVSCWGKGKKNILVVSDKE